MSLNSVLLMLFGAALVAIGVLASALADRVRGLKVSREVAPRERAARAQSAPAVITVVEAVEQPRSAPATPAKQPRVPRAESTPAAAPEGGEDVIAALVAAGYKKPLASEATWACGAAERSTVEAWVASALRRCARGGLS